MMQTFLGLEGFEVRTLSFQTAPVLSSVNRFARSILLHPLFFAPVLHIHLNESKLCGQGPTPTL